MQGNLSRFNRVYLVDDHDIVRRGVRDLLVPARDIDVVGDSGSARAAVPEIIRLAPDVMLLDLHLQDGTGIQVSRAVRSVNPSVAALLLTAASDDEAMASAILAGASGYLVKVGRSTHLMAAIREARPGATLMEADAVRRATQLLLSVIESLTPAVTEDERAVLHLVVEGRTDSQITEAFAADGRRLDVDIVELVARVADALPAHGGAPVEQGTGKHRRPG